MSNMKVAVPCCRRSGEADPKAQSPDLSQRLEGLKVVRGEPLSAILQNWMDSDYLRYAIQAEIARLGLEVGEEALQTNEPALAWEAVEAAWKANLYDQRITRLAMRTRAALGDLDGVRRMLLQAEIRLDDDEDLDPDTRRVATELLEAHRSKQQRLG